MENSQNKIICKNCGAEIKEGNNFCTNCGIKLVKDNKLNKGINDITTERQEVGYSKKEKNCIVIISIFTIAFMIYLLIRQGVIKIGGFYL